MMAVYSFLSYQALILVPTLITLPLISLALVICMLTCLVTMLDGEIEEAVCRLVYFLEVPGGYTLAGLDSDLPVWEYGDQCVDACQMLPAPVAVLEEAFDCAVDTDLGCVLLVLMLVLAEPMEPSVERSVALLDIETDVW